MVALTTVSTVAVVVANGALDDATRDPIERQGANALADRLVAADGALAARENVLNETRVEEFDADALRALDAVPPDADVRVRVDGETVVETGNVAGGTTVRRVALVVDREPRTVTPGLDGRDRVTLPRRTPWVIVAFAPSAGEVRTVRANGRVVLHDPDSLAAGEYRVNVSRRTTPTLSFAGDDLATGAVELTYAPADSRKVVLEVTVDA